MKVGCLTLNRFNGQEQFNISKATILKFERDGEIELNFEIETAPEPIKIPPDTKDLRARPNAEFTVAVTDFSPETLVGSSFTIPGGYSDEIDDYPAIFYYCEHEVADETEIKIIERNGTDFHVAITATCVDVNYYDDSKPRTKIEIDAWFTPRNF